MTRQELKDRLERLRHFPRVIPPRELRRAGKDIAGYLKGGNGELRQLVELAGLTPESRLLDVGCGDGRLASRMSSYLKGGGYSSFEVQKRFVDYLDRHIGRKRHFDFVHADIWHSYYNPKGKHRTTEYRFPYADATFDVVFLNSIFTHFRPPEIEHYLMEIHRVLVQGGRVLATFFIANPESIALDEQGQSHEGLRKNRPKLLNYSHEHYWSRDPEIHEHLIAVDEAWLRDVYARAGLAIKGVFYGRWCGREEGRSQQDIVMAVKNDGNNP